MPTIPIRSSKQFILAISAICAVVFAPAAWLLYWVVYSVSNPIWRTVWIAVIILIPSVLLGVLIRFLFVHFIYRLISNVEALAPDGALTASGAQGLSSALNRFNNLLEQIADDQRSLRRRNRQLRVLATISQALNRASSPNEMLLMALEHTLDLLLYEKGYIALTDPETGELAVAASRGYMVPEIERLTLESRTDHSTLPGITLPLQASSETIGVLHLDAECPDEDVQHLLQLSVGILAAAVEKHRLFEATQREVRAQTLLNQAGRMLTSTLDKQEVLTRIMGEVTQALNAEAGSVLLVDESQGDMFFAAAASPAADLLIGTRMSLDQGIVGWTIKNHKSVLVEDAHHDPRFYAKIDLRTGLQTRSVLCVPLLSKERVVGAIEVIDSRSGRFKSYDLRLLESLAPQAVIAIENASLHESIKAQMAELERTQDQLLQAEKLSAIGQLVAGVAHELNNPLTAIVGYSQLLLESCEDQEMCEDLARIDREAQRSARIVQSLLSFARQNKLEKRLIDLGDALNATADLLAYQLEVDNVSVIRTIQPEPMVVMADMYQLQQVFLNLINNAHQAMRKAHGSGQLIIRAHSTGRGSARISFVDDGPGITKENISRVFDPFFTTKDVGEGTGLGLSICLGIVQEHQGHIWVESELGRGAAFHIELPLCPEVGEASLEGQQKALASASRWSVLVVDDEAEIARLLKRVLETEGHAVTAVDSGLAALEMLGRQKFDLVICDLKMPGMSGRELYAYLKQTQPETARHMVFSTGDVVSDESWAFLREVGNRFLSKPFKPEQVSALIHEVVSD